MYGPFLTQLLVEVYGNANRRVEVWEGFTLCKCLSACSCRVACGRQSEMAPFSIKEDRHLV